MAIHDIRCLTYIANSFIQKGLLELNALTEQFINVFCLGLIILLRAVFRDVIRSLLPTEQTRMADRGYGEALFWIM